MKATQGEQGAFVDVTEVPEPAARVDTRWAWPHEGGER